MKIIYKNIPEESFFCNTVAVYAQTDLGRFGSNFG